MAITKINQSPLIHFIVTKPNTKLPHMQMMTYCSHTSTLILYISHQKQQQLSVWHLKKNMSNPAKLFLTFNRFCFFSSCLSISPQRSQPCYSILFFQPMEILPANISSTPSTEPLLPLLTPDATNCTAWDQRWGTPHLHRLAHLDVQLYQDFYAVWVSLMVRF